MPTSVQLGFDYMASQQSGAEFVFDDAAFDLDAFVQLSVKARQTAPPGSPVEGDRYLPIATATGAWAGLEGKIQVEHNGAWKSYTPREGWRMWVDNEDRWYVYDGTNWVETQTIGGDLTLLAGLLASVQGGITASTTQTQGQQALTKTLNQVSVCANANDVVTLPAAVAGLICIVKNSGAQTLQVFPASGDKIDDAAADASTTIVTLKGRLFFAKDATDWYSILSA
jgi:hypothetical protein